MLFIIGILLGVVIGVFIMRLDIINTQEYLTETIKEIVKEANKE
jgi:uncharacterized membrane-anchored protein YhcB (DUF1043 family)